MQRARNRSRQLQQLAAVVPITTGDDGLPMPMATQQDVVTAAKQITGENDPLRPDAATRNMANRQLRFQILDLGRDLAAVQAVDDAQQLQITALQQVLAEQLGPQLTLLVAQQAQTLATVQAEQTKLAANTLADEAKGAWLAQVDAEGKATKALAIQTRDEAAANKLAIKAAEARATAQQLQIDANTLAIQATDAKATAAATQSAEAKAAAATADAKAVAAQNKADAAAAKADTAQTKADLAQAKADASTAKADAATAVANTATANASTAISTATTAANTANAAQAAVTALAAKFREKRQPTPAMATGASVRVTVTFDTPYADTNYTAVGTLQGDSLISCTATMSDVAADKKPGSCVFILKNAGLLALLNAAGTLHVLAQHS